MEELISQVRSFAKERGWEAYHNPKNLAMALSVEVSELVEHFQWATCEESRSPDAKRLDEIKDEVGDIMIYLANLADKLGIDPVQAAKDKLVKAREKYPVSAARSLTWFRRS